MKRKLLMLSTGAALLMSPMWAQEQQKSTTTTTQAQPSTPASQTWTGTLYDADCKTATPNEKCDVRSKTRTFGLMLADGKSAKLDTGGNEKVRTALQARKGKASGEVQASVTGSIDGEVIKVDSVQIL